MRTPSDPDLRMLDPRATVVPGLLVGALLAIVVAGQHFADTGLRDGSQQLWHILVHALWWWGTWGLLVPVVAILARRFPVLPRLTARSALVHVGVATLLFTARLLIYRALGEVTALEVSSIVTKGSSDLATYAVTLAALVIATLYERDRQREATASRLAAEVNRLQGDLMRSQLDALRFQLQPHFLFNALQCVSTLMHRDAPAAEELLERLARLLRQALAPRSGQGVSLREELDVAQTYMEISRTRFGDRLQYSTDVPVALLEAIVPFFLLQPLLENAIHHGIERRGGRGSVSVTASATGRTLVLTIEDRGGAARPVSGVEEYGIGLSNTRQRLDQLYGGEQSLRLYSPDDHRTVCEVRFPL